MAAYPEFLVTASSSPAILREVLDRLEIGLAEQIGSWRFLILA